MPAFSRASTLKVLSAFALRLIHLPPRLLYAVGLGSLIGRVGLLLTTTGRRTGLPRVTPLQYEEIGGVIFVVAMRGLKADWVRNLRANPKVQVRIRSRCLSGRAETITDPARIADFIQVRLERHPRMIAAILRAEGVAVPASRAELEQYAANLTLVAIRPDVQVNASG